MLLWTRKQGQFLIVRWWNGAFQQLWNTVSPPAYFKWGTLLQTNPLLQLGWISLKWYLPIKNHLLLIVLVSSDLFCHGNDILTFGRSCCEPWGCQTLSLRPRCTGQRKEAQSSQGDYFFNKRKHSEGKCLKEVVIQREMTKWLLWLETKQISTATFFISVRNAVRGREVNCVEAKENRNQRWREKEG